MRLIEKPDHPGQQERKKVNTMQANKLETQSNDPYEFLTRNLPRVARSDGTIEEFNPNRISDSIMREIPSISYEQAKSITEDVVRRFLSSENDVITAPSIREQVCSILHGLNAKWRFEYSRLGIPFHDFNESWGGFFEGISDKNLSMSIDEALSKMDDGRKNDLLRMIARNYIDVKNRIQKYDRA